MNPIGQGAPPPSRYNIPFHNASSEEIPAYAVVEIDDVSNFGTNTLYEAQKPTAGNSDQYVINSPSKVAAGTYGGATNQYPCDVAISGSPAVGDEIGPTNGSWLMSASGVGFIYLGGLASGVGRVMPVKGEETFRLIRGESVGAQSGGTLNLDNIIVLSGGLDPSAGNPATVVTAHNLFSQSYSDNDKIQVVYSPEVTAGVDWETLKTTGTESFRLIRGLAKGDVTADDTSFIIDNVIPLSSGNDPVSGVSATEIVVANIQKEAFEDNTPITAIYSPAVLTDVDWELVVVERYRLVRGEVVSASSSGTFTIDNIRVLASGVDPRSDPTSTTETLTVTNLFSDSYATDEKVIAAYNVVLNIWEVISRGNGGLGNSINVKISGQISARSGTTRGSGTAQPVNDATLADEGSTITVYNLSGNTYEGGVSGGPLFCSAHKRKNGDYYIDWTDLRGIASFDDNRVIAGTSGLPEWRDLDVTLDLDSDSLDVGLEVGGTEVSTDSVVVGPCD